MKNVHYVRSKNGRYVGAWRIDTTAIVLILITFFLASCVTFSMKPANAKIESIEIQTENAPVHSVEETKQEVYKILEGTVDWSYDVIGGQNVNEWKEKYPRADRKDIEKILLVVRDTGFKDIKFLFELMGCESDYGNKLVNGKGNKPSTSIDRGYYMYNSYWHKEISDKCAFDISCSTRETIKDLQEGKKNQWVCTKILAKKGIKLEM